MIILDYKDPRPVYEQVADKITRLIEQGVLTNEEKLPSVRQLAMELSINPNTVQKAYGELEHRGLIYSKSGLGNFVCFDETSRQKYLEKERENFANAVQKAREAGISSDELINIVKSHSG